MAVHGEAFNPNGLMAAHNYLPVPTFVRGANLEAGKFILIRVNDRGPLPSDHTSRSGERIIDISLKAVNRFGSYASGTTVVRVEAIPVTEQ
jgi:rare lipoprotein A